jgi:hypothetical protein
MILRLPALKSMAPPLLLACSLTAIACMTDPDDPGDPAATRLDGQVDEHLGVESQAITVKVFEDQFDNQDLWWRLGSQGDTSNYSMVYNGRAGFSSTLKTWIGREFALTGLPIHDRPMCRVKLDTQLGPVPIANGTWSEGTLRVKVRDAVTQELLLDQRFSLGRFTTWEDSKGTVTTDMWRPLDSGRVIVNLIADKPEPNRVNLYVVDNLRLSCITQF